MRRRRNLGQISPAQNEAGAWGLQDERGGWAVDMVRYRATPWHPFGAPVALFDTRQAAIDWGRSVGYIILD